MSQKRRRILVILGVGVAVAAWSAFLFIVWFAPGWPDTLLGWLIAASVGLPAWILAEAFAEIASSQFQRGPSGVYGRYSLEEVEPRIPLGHRLLQVSVRTLIAVVGLAGLIGFLWLVLTALQVDAVRSQF